MSLPVPHYLKIKAHPPVFGDERTGGVTIITNHRQIFLKEASWQELKAMILAFEASGRETQQNYKDEERERVTSSPDIIPRAKVKATLEDLA